MEATPTDMDSGMIIFQLQQQVIQLSSLVNNLLHNQSQYQSQHQQPQHQSTYSPSIKVSPPTVFAGDINLAETFLSQLDIYFQGMKVHDDSDKIITALSYMKGGTAGSWAKLKLKEFKKENDMTWDSFLEDFNQDFADPDPGSTARFKMEQLKQDSQTAEQFVASFKELIEDTGYNDTALIEKFEARLKPALVDKIYGLSKMPKTIESWMGWAIKFDRQWRQRESNKKLLALSSSSKKPTTTLSTQRPFKPHFSSQQFQPTMPAKQPDVVPMEVDSGWKKVKSIVCFKCRKPGHIARDCQASVDINSMDFDTLKAYMKEELQKDDEQNTTKKDF